jgi:hypothetical protein
VNAEVVNGTVLFQDKDAVVLFIGRVVTVVELDSGGAVTVLLRAWLEEVRSDEVADGTVPVPLLTVGCIVVLLAQGGVTVEESNECVAVRELTE